jgi:hypothetical protein
MGLTRQAVQRLANEMEQDGLVRFGPNPYHRRAKLVFLTSCGEVGRSPWLPIDPVLYSLHFDQIRIKLPVESSCEPLIPMFRCPGGTIGISRSANLDRSLQTSKRVSVGAQEILEEAYSIARHD